MIKNTNVSEDFNSVSENDMQKEENSEKVIAIIGKVQLIYKRVILGIIIAILLVITLIDTAIFKQTLKARNYIETTAVYVDKKDNGESSIFDDYIYTFEDNKGVQQKIIMSFSKDTHPEEEIKLKYNEDNPQDYYNDGMTFDKSEFIWYIVKIVVLILLVILFFNKKLLSKVNMSVGTSKE